MNLAQLKWTLASQEALILILNDIVAKRVAVAWKIYRPTFKEPPAKPNEDIHHAIARLWEEVTPIDYDRLAEIAGVPVTRATRAFNRLRAANLIFPDGTFTDQVRMIVVGDVGGYAGVLAKQAAALTPKDKGKAENGGERKKQEDKKADRKPAKSKARR